MSDLSTIALGNRSPGPAVQPILPARRKRRVALMYLSTPAYIKLSSLKVPFNGVMDVLTVDSDGVHEAWVAVKALHEHRRILTQDISARDTMDEVCSQNKLFGYL